MIRGLSGNINMLCNTANVSRAGYYRWLKYANRPDKDYADYLRIKDIFDKSKGKYGWRNLKMRLPEMNHKKIQRIMKKYDLITKVRRRNPYRQIMKKRLEHRIFPNLLRREFRQHAPSKFFCTDITYLPFAGGFVYLSVIKDIASGEVAAWNASKYLNLTLVTETVKKMRLNSLKNILIHSDQGFHYTSPDYINALRGLNAAQSMSAKGNCIDNAPIESFFGHLKDELDYRTCASFDELAWKIGQYMRYYNYERKQWSRQRMAPVEYRNYLLAKT